MTKWIGRLLMAGGLIHVVSAIAIYPRVIGEIVSRGIFDTVPGNPEVGVFVWSVFFGCVAFIGGIAVNAREHAQVAIPQSIAWSLLVLGMIGIVLVPLSGFWLLFPAVIGILRHRSATR